MGMEDRPPTAGELRLMEEGVARCMEEGAGISAGLIYTPDKYQSTEEPVALAKAAARCDGILDMHMRNEAEHMAEALEEAIHIGREDKTPWPLARPSGKPPRAPCWIC